MVSEESCKCKGLETGQDKVWVCVCVCVCVDGEGD